MFFKNLTFMQLPGKDLFDGISTPELLDRLALQLSLDPFIPGTQWPPGQTERLGWFPPHGGFHGQMVHVANGCALMKLRIETKVMPAAAIKALVDEKARVYEEREGHPPGKRMKAQIKDEIIADKLPGAFVIPREISAYVDARRRLFVIDTASGKAVDAVCRAIRRIMGSWPVYYPTMNSMPASILTGWFQAGVPQGVRADVSCVFEDEGGDGKANLKSMNGRLEEVRELLGTGMNCTRLALTWNEKLSCTLDADLVVRSVKFLGIEPTEDDDAAVAFDADFALMTGEIGAFWDAMVGWFDGIKEAV